MAEIPALKMEITLSPELKACFDDLTAKVDALNQKLDASIKIDIEPVTFRQTGPELEAAVAVSSYRNPRLT